MKSRTSQKGRAKKEMAETEEGREEPRVPLGDGGATEEVQGLTGAPRCCT